MTGDRVALIDSDESHVDVPDLDLALPDNAAGLDDGAHDLARKPWPLGKPPLPPVLEFAVKWLAEVRAVE